MLKNDAECKMQERNKTPRLEKGLKITSEQHKFHKLALNSYNLLIICIPSMFY
jgi:hypothetical protein